MQKDIKVTMRNITYTSCLFIAALMLWSGCAKIYTAMGDKNLEQLQYTKAVKNYEKALVKKPNENTQKKVANTYRLLNDNKKSMEAYSKVVAQSNVEPMDKIYYAQSLMANRKYEDAAASIKEYLKNNPGNKMIEGMLNACQNTGEFMKDTTKYAVTPAKIGTVTEFFAPVKYKDGIVISANVQGTRKDKTPQDGKSYNKLYFLKKDNAGVYSAPEKLKGHINKSNLHVAAATYSPAGNEVYYTANNTDGMSKSDMLESIIGLKIAKDTIENGEYKKGIDFQFNSKEYSTGHPALTKDGKTMYFISDMPGGLGGTDIYETKMVNGQWTQPVNCGDKVNTMGNEMFPFVDSLGTLYYSSNGHSGMGGLDIFKNRKEGMSWKAVENLNYPVNSSADDFGFMIYADNKNGYLSSNRSGSDKIYEFIMQSAKVQIKGLISDKDGKPLAGVKIEIFDKSRNVTDSIFSGADGTYTYMLAPDTDFEITLSKDGFFSQSDDITTVNIPGPIVKDFKMEKLTNEPVVLDGPDLNGVRPIFYDFNKWEIRKDAHENLDKLVKKLKDNPDIVIELGSHTDCRGTADYNQNLSFKRAKSAKSYLVKKVSMQVG